MVITESIQKAIQSAIDKCGSLLSFSRSVGVSHTTVAYWLSGRTRKSNSTVWDNLHPLIQEFLEPGSGESAIRPNRKPPEVPPTSCTKNMPDDMVRHRTCRLRCFSWMT